MSETTPENIPSKTKPEKPTPDFPLWPHPSGQWAKKINQKVYYFGVWADPKAAKARYLNEVKDIMDGREVQRGDGLTVRELVNAFLTSKQLLVDSGELSQRTWDFYHRISSKVIEIFGKNRHVEKLRPVDFEHLRAEFAKTHGPVSLAGDVTGTRVLFKYGYDADLIDRPVKHGPNFKAPSRKTLRKDRASKGKRSFSAPQARAILEAASPQLRAMAYLGLNCGFGNHDVAILPMSALDLQAGWVEFERPKTGVHRRCPLWPETVEAIQVAIRARPKPKSKKLADIVFITSKGNAWTPKGKCDCPVSKETAKILKELGYHKKGLSFYGFRRSFETEGEKARDKDALRAIMGWVESANDMSTIYNQEPVEDYRLEAVTNHVRAWLKNTE